MLEVVESIRARAHLELQQIVNKFKLKASSYFVDKLTVGMVSHLMVNGKSLGSSCSFKQLSNGSLELLPFERAACGHILRTVKLSNLGLCPELKSGVVFVPLPHITSFRRSLVLKSLFLVLEQFKSSARSVRRRAIAELKAIKAIECDLRRVYLKQIEDSVFGCLSELQRVYNVNERRLSLN
ncbi:ribosome recycling factor [Candidatus Hodgkinia cicadicola]